MANRIKKKTYVELQFTGSKIGNPLAGQKFCATTALHACDPSAEDLASRRWSWASTHKMTARRTGAAECRCRCPARVVANGALHRRWLRTQVFLLDRQTIVPRSSHAWRCPSLVLERAGQASPTMNLPRAKWNLPRAKFRRWKPKMHCRKYTRFTGL